MADERVKSHDEVFCKSCGEAIKSEAELCPKCGVRQSGSSDDSSVPMLLNILLGLISILGVGHIVKGRTGKGILFLAGGLLLNVLFWLTVWFGIGLIWIPVYIALWVWSIVDVKK